MLFVHSSMVRRLVGQFVVLFETAPRVEELSSTYLEFMDDTVSIKQFLLHTVTTYDGILSANSGIFYPTQVSSPLY